MNTLNEIRAVCVAYEVAQDAKTQMILNNISYCWKSGVTYAIWGASGSGKSTLLHLLAGFQCPTRGSIWYGAQSHETLSEHDRTQLRLHNMSYVVQQAPLITACSVIENVIITGLIAGLPYNSCLDRGYELLTEVGLPDHAHASPHTLSGGEQQRVALARALWNTPQWLLLDEPTAHLDQRSKQDIIALLLNVHHKHKTGMIVATHDEAVAQALQERVLLQDGCIRNKL